MGHEFLRHPADDVRRQHSPAVLANQVLLAGRWGRPCRAYNVCIQPDPAEAAALAGLQASVLRRKPSLLRVPEPALHASLAWLLPVHQEFGRPKDALWQRHGPRWLATVADAAATTTRFRLTFRQFVATDSAVIAVADEPNQLGALRRDLVPLLDVPGSSSSGGLAHITLFRYATPLHAPARLLHWLEGTGFREDIDVRELVIVKERVYPALDIEILHRVPLAPSGPAGQPAMRPR
jgi:hypothetical protein